MYTEVYLPEFRKNAIAGSYKTSGTDYVMVVMGGEKAGKINIWFLDYNSNMKFEVKPYKFTHNES